MKIGLITRCRNEPYVNEFVNHYINEGVDGIYIVDDESREDTFRDVARCPAVQVVTGLPFTNGPELQVVYDRIRKEYDWILIADMDEYITAKKNIHNTVRDELLTTFRYVECVKIPWVMMAFNGIEGNPECLLETNTYRWNHSKKHRSASKERKLRCRYREIETKCAFKTEAFDRVWYHGPIREDLDGVRVVDGIYNKEALLDPYYRNLREKDISRAFLLCFHHRGVSKQRCREKRVGTHIKPYRRIHAEELIARDFPEVVDETLRVKSRQRPNLFAGEQQPA